MLDHGITYAAKSFYDSGSDRQVTRGMLMMISLPCRFVLSFPHRAVSVGVSSRR
jgi:hypothetical protein